VHHFGYNFKEQLTKALTSPIHFTVLRVQGREVGMYCDEFINLQVYVHLGVGVVFCEALS